MSIETAKKAADSLVKFKDENIASIKAQYGEPMARVVADTTDAMFLASGIVLVVVGEDIDLITELMLTDLTSKLVARTVHLAEKAYGMPEEQRAEAIALSKELRTKLMEKCPKE